MEARGRNVPWEAVIMAGQELLAESLSFISLSGSQEAGALALTWFHVLGCLSSSCFNKT